MGLVQRTTSTGDKQYAVICDVIQQAVNTVTADYSGVPGGAKGFTYALGSNLAATARTITERHDISAKQIVFAGLEPAGVAVACSTTSGSFTITSAAAFSIAQHTGAAITHANIPADTYIVSVETTSSATISKPATATGAGAGATLFDRIILTLLQ